MILKSFERVLYEQTAKFTNKGLFPKLRSFTKDDFTQCAHLNLCQIYLCTSNISETVLLDFLKAYGCSLHDFLIAKPETYDFNKDALNSISDYFTKKLQHLEVRSIFFKIFAKTIRWVQQDSILRPLSVSQPSRSDIVLLIQEATLWLTLYHVRKFVNKPFQNYLAIIILFLKIPKLRKQQQTLKNVRLNQNLKLWLMSNPYRVNKEWIFLV